MKNSGSQIQVAAPSNKAVLQSDDSCGTVLFVLLADYYGLEEITTWSPETILLEVQDDFQVELSQRNLDKLMAARVIVTTDLFYKSLPTFIRLCNALGDQYYDADIFDPADPEEMAWSLTEATLLRPDINADTLDAEIKAYINEVLSQQAFTGSPDSLSRFVSYRNTFADDVNMATADPQGFEMMATVGYDKKAAVDAYVESKLRQLAQQLEQLKLQHGNTQNIVQKIQQILDE